MFQIVSNQMKFALFEGLEHFHEIAEKEVENARQGINHYRFEEIKNTNYPYYCSR